MTELQYDATALLYSSYLSGNGTDIASGMTHRRGRRHLRDRDHDVFRRGQHHRSISGEHASAGAAVSQFPARGSDSVLRNQGQHERIADGQHRLLDLFWRSELRHDPRRLPWAAASPSIPTATFTSPAPRTSLYTGCSGCSSTDFPILNPYQPCLDQAPPTVVVNSSAVHEHDEAPRIGRLRGEAQSQRSQGQQLIWSTYLGGTGTDSGQGIALDTGAANVYIVGTTNSIDIGSSVTTLSHFRLVSTLPGQPDRSRRPTACTTPARLLPERCLCGAPDQSDHHDDDDTPINVALNYFSYLGGSSDEAGRRLRWTRAAARW